MRARDLDRLTATTYDVLVIGGGIYGLALAYEAASRGLKTALVDAGDFGGATSFNHQKTVHGGLRSLQTGRVDRALDSIRERRTMARIAPWLLRPLPFLLGTKIELDDAFGFTLQAGFDVSIGGGWYLNADVKKTFIDTDASWGSSGVTAEVDIDPWIYSLGVGYRFNLDDIFSRRAEAAPLKAYCLALFRRGNPLQSSVPFSRRSQYQRTASTISAPMTAESTSRNEIAYWSSEVSRPNIRNRRPPTNAPASPTRRLEVRPNPLRSRVTINPTMLPAISPTKSQTTT